jgi:hydrogenase nickel incorporation protein HypA/HybF
MHELSLMESIITAVHSVAEQNNMTQVKLISIKIGELTSAYPAALRAAFEALSDDPLISSATLEISTIPINAHCRDCHCDFRPEHYQFICPVCHSFAVDMESGQEMYIDFIEGA